MTTTMTPATRDAYVEAVRVALSSQSEDVRNDVLDDVAEHLRELELEGDASLRDLLGEPDAYAAEFLASAGIDARVGTRHRLLQAVSGRLERAKQKYAGTRVDEVLRFVRSLQPAWWLVRGWVVLNAIALMNDHGKVFGIPRVMEGHTLANLALLVGATALSFWFARGPRPLAWAAGVVSVIALIGVLHSDQPSRYIDSGATYGDDTPVSDYSGTEVNNLFVYDANGKPIKSAYVLRDDGMPLDLGNGQKLLDYSSALDAKPVKYSYVPGLFPQPQVVADFDEYGGYDVKVDLPKHPKVVVPKVPGTSSNDRSP